MFSTFEHTVDLIYSRIIQRRKEDCSTAQQLGVTCFAAYTAGAAGTIISNPADNVMTSLYKKKAESAMQVGFHVIHYFIFKFGPNNLIYLKYKKLIRLTFLVLLTFRLSRTLGLLICSLEVFLYVSHS